MIIKKIATFIAIFLPFASFARSDYPNVGLIHHNTENSSLQYKCEIHRSELHCDMTQNFVRPMIPKDKLEQKAKELLDSITKEKIEPKRCEDLANTLGQVNYILNNPIKIPEENRAAFSQMPEEQIQSTITLLEKSLLACKSGALSDFIVVRNLILKDQASTCRVGSHSWKEVFQKGSSKIINGEVLNVWVTKDSPSGACGVVLLNRFEEVFSGTGKLKFWEYTARKAVTNPSGASFGMQCKDWDEGTYLYGWRARDLYLGCNKINFSSF
jgi:hypothetical protein